MQTRLTTSQKTQAWLHQCLNELENRGLLPLVYVDGEYYPITFFFLAPPENDVVETNTPILFIDPDDVVQFLLKENVS